MTTQIGVLLDLVNAVETNMETICTLATNVKIPKQIILNLSVAMISIVECQTYLAQKLATWITMINSSLTSMDNYISKSLRHQLTLKTSEMKIISFILKRLKTYDS